SEALLPNEAPSSCFFPRLTPVAVAPCAPSEDGTEQCPRSGRRRRISSATATFGWQPSGWTTFRSAQEFRANYYLTEPSSDLLLECPISGRTKPLTGVPS